MNVYGGLLFPVGSAALFVTGVGWATAVHTRSGASEELPFWWPARAFVAGAALAVPAAWWAGSMVAPLLDGVLCVLAAVALSNERPNERTARGALVAGSFVGAGFGVVETVSSLHIGSASSFEVWRVALSCLTPAMPLVLTAWVANAGLRLAWVRLGVAVVSSLALRTGMQHVARWDDHESMVALMIAAVVQVVLYRVVLHAADGVAPRSTEGMMTIDGAPGVIRSAHLRAERKNSVLAALVLSTVLGLFAWLTWIAWSR